MNKVEFSKIIRDCIEEKKFNKCEIARRTGFSRRAIQNWAQAKDNITLENADKLLKALGVEIKIGGTK